MGARAWDGRQLGERLFRRRLDLGLTIIEVARKSGLTRLTIASVETGDSDPRVSTFVAICLALGLQPSETLKGLLP